MNLKTLPNRITICGFECIYHYSSLLAIFSYQLDFSMGHCGFYPNPSWHLGHQVLEQSQLL